MILFSLYHRASHLIRLSVSFLSLYKDSHYLRFSTSSLLIKDKITFESVVKVTKFTDMNELQIVQKKRKK